MHNKQASCQQGFTLIELMITIAIIAIVLSLAVPSFNDFFEKNRLKRAAEETYGLVTRARAEGVIRSADMAVDVDTGEWCVGYAAGGCDCTETDPDVAGACAVPVGDDADGNPEMVLQAIDGTSFAGVDMTTGSDISFNHVKGTAGPGRVTLAADAWILEVIVSNMGLVRICAHADSRTTMGYPEC